MSTMRTASMRGSRRFGAEQGRGLAALDAAPEFPLGGDDQMLVERIGVGLDLDPLAAAGNDREHRTPRRNDPHVMLQLRHVFLGGRLFGKIPGQHELRLEHSAARPDAPVGRGRHPADGRMADAASGHR